MFANNDVRLRLPSLTPSLRRPRASLPQSRSQSQCVVRGGGGCWYWPQYASDAPTRNGPAAPGLRVGGNTVHTETGNVSVANGKYSLAEWVAMGHDTGSVARPLPTDMALVAQMRNMLSVAFSRSREE